MYNDSIYIYIWKYYLITVIYCGWLRNPAPVENGGLSHYNSMIYSVS